MHACTLRSDDLPDGIASEAAPVDLLFRVAQVDGVFTDSPDRTLEELIRSGRR